MTATWQDASAYLEALDDARQPRDHGVSLPAVDSGRHEERICACGMPATHRHTQCSACRSKRWRELHAS